MKRSLRSWLWRVPIDQEVDEELAFHIEMRTRELVEGGMDPKTARKTATSRLGDVAHVKRRCVDLGRKRDREMRLTQWLDEVRGDVTFTLRQLRRSPGFTAVAAITLALGIGANSAMFALADATLMRPLPYPEPDRLVMVWERSATTPRMPASPLNLHDWAEQNRTFDGMAAIATGAGGGPLLTAPDGTVRSVDRQTVTTRFFDVLGVRPVAGRTFLPADEGPAPTALVMSEGLWRAFFGGDPTLIGRDIRLSGQPFTVIGIVPDEVQFVRPGSIWTLLPSVIANVNLRAPRFLQVVGRLEPGVTLDAAQADLSVIADALARAFPETNKDRGVTVEPLRAGIMGRDLQLTSVFLLGVVGFVLLACCANVANLLLARASVRARELAVRSALGAGRARIVGQLLTESLVLAAVGGVLGVAVGAAILTLAPALIPAGLLPAAVKLTFDGRVVLFSAVATGIVGVLFGLVPAWQATSTSLVQAIASDSRSATRSGGRFRSVLVAGEVGAAVLLLCGAGLLLRTLLALGSFDTGYRAESDSVLTLDFSLPPPRPGSAYPTPAWVLQFYDAVARDVSALPNVRSVGWASGLPFGTSELGPWPFEVVGDTPLAAAERPSADYQIVSPGYFRTLDLPIVAGRAFTELDTSATTPVCIVNEAFVRRHLPGRNPVGARVAIRPAVLGSTAPPAMEIVGVARQVKGRLAEPAELVQVYVPLAQNPWTDTYLVVQPSAGRAEALIPAIRAAVARLDSNVPVRRERTLADLAALTTAEHRFRALMVGTFSALALVLAMVGIFGVLAYSVEQRTRELGVRIALGATATNVLGLVLGGAAGMIVVGAVIGLTAAAALGQTMSTFLFGVQPLDPVTFVSVAAVLALTAAVATVAPAVRAVRIDPVVAFRNE